MSLIVEDATGLSTAESYLSVSDADAYFAAHGAPATWTGATAVKETALRMATQYMDAVYGSRWQGERFADDQRLDWPRAWVEIDGVEVDEAPLPRALTEACAELAHRHLTETGGLFPDVDTERNVASESDSVGPLSTSRSYVGSKPTQKRYSMVEAIISRLLQPAGRAVRI